MGLGGSRVFEAGIGGGRDAVGAAKILCEPLRAFERSGGASRAECLDAGAFEIVNNPGAERRLGPDDDQIDAVLAAKRDDRRMIGQIERNALGLLRNPGIARRAIKPPSERASRHFPCQSVLPPA